MKFTDNEVLEMAEILDRVSDADVVRTGKKIKAAQVYMAKHPGCRQSLALAIMNKAYELFGEELK